MSACNHKIQFLGVSVLTTLVLFFSSTLIAAPTGFYQEFGDATRDIGNDVVQLDDGSYVVVGSTRSIATGDYDVWVTRLDEHGTPLWQRTYGGTDHESPFSVIASGDGGVVFTAFIGEGSFGGSKQDAWVVRLDIVGDILWQKIFTGPGFDQIRAAKLLPDGGFALAGFTSPGYAPIDLWVIRINSLGNTIWEKIYPAASSGLGMVVAADGNLLVTALSDDSPTNLLLTKIDSSNGTVMWAKQYGGAGSDRGNDLIELPDGNIVVSGSSSSFGSSGRDAWVFRTDSSGNLEWQVAFGGPGSDSASGIGYINGDIVIAGSNEFNSPTGNNFGWMARLDAGTGALLWRHSVGGMDGFNTGLGLDITLDGGAVSVGTVNTGTTLPLNLGDIYVAKVDSIGTNLGCPALTNEPALLNTTSATVIPLALAGVDFYSGEITSLALPNNAPITTALVCFMDPLIFLADLGDLLLSLDLSGGLESSLSGKLDSADNILADANPNNDQAAINKLGAFIEQLIALRGKKLTDAEADELIARAEQIINILQA